MNTYAQNKEDLYILNYFAGYKGTLLEIGANDGRTLSNSLAFIEQGWEAHLIEPGQTFGELLKLHQGSVNVFLYNYALGGEFNKESVFYESGAHVPGGSDQGLVSSLDFDETERWRKAGVAFTERIVPVKTFTEFWKEAGRCKFDYISIDCEGHDWDILQQINLDDVGCRVLCIEWNGDTDLMEKFSGYCKAFSIIHVNSENLIFVR